MKYPWIDDYLMHKRGVTRDLQMEWNWIRYQIGGKMFAAILLDDQNQPYYINLKLEPLEGELMRSQYPDIIPGYYSNKHHWNSVKADGDIPDDMLRHWLDRSYSLVLKAFSKQKQREILGLTVCGKDCSICPLHGTCQSSGTCTAPDGKRCPIFACCNRQCLTTCASCVQIPCEIWQAVREPSITDEAFRKSISDRIAALRSAALMPPCK